ncbi:MAG TPA: pyridoxamine 5'-phosphate oxidase family protein [Rhodocyclaceae bacterium]
MPADQPAGKVEVPLSRLDLLVELLHSQGEAAIATQAAALPGYPLATAVAFATDEHHRPVMLISKLAEHTRNLAADPRCSFLIARVGAGGEIARVSLVGDVQAIAADDALTERYLRYHPEAERFLQLGDFGFHRLEPKRALVVGGFGKAAWIEGERLVDAPSLPPDAEARLVAAMAGRVAAGTRLLGVDPYGADLSVGGSRRRIRFSVGPVVADALPATLERELAP